MPPTDAIALCDKGKMHLEAKKFQQAVESLTAAINVDSGFAEAYYHRGIAYISLKEFRKAIEDFSEAVRQQSHWHSCYTWRASCLLRIKHYDALADLNKALELAPDDAPAYSLRGSVQQRQDEHESALNDFTQAIRLNPAAMDSYLHRGSSYLHLGLIAEAIADFNRFIDDDPTLAHAYRLRGDAWLHDSEYEQAISDFSQAIELDPEDSDAYYYRGVAHRQIEDYSQAISDFTRVIEIDPKAGGYRARAHVWDLLDEPDKADADYNLAEELDTEGSDHTMQQQRTLVLSMLKDHFDPISLADLCVSERAFPTRVRADLQMGIESLLAEYAVCHFCGVHSQYSHEGLDFTSLLVRDQHHPPLAVAPQYEDLDIGEPEPLRCLKDGLWLLKLDDQPSAIFLEPRSAYRRREEIRIQIATANDEAGVSIAQEFLKRLEKAVHDAKCYRGKILSLENTDDYSGKSSGIKVHKLRSVDKDQVILPVKTLQLLDRNVINFVRQRPRLAELGMATKKGLLFYGPPGTGKTHTIHYLAGALKGMTTLLVAAEQVALLGDYMTLARLLQPCMVVVEDADLIARERSSMSSSCEEVLLNKLLNEMDGLRESADILFVLTTNRPESLEAALASRPGRIDQAIEFPYPDEPGRHKLVHLYSGKASPTAELVEHIVRRTENVSAAFIKELMRRATQFQLERELESDAATQMTIEDINNALDELLFSGGSLNRKLLGGDVESGGE